MGWPPSEHGDAKMPLQRREILPTTIADRLPLWEHEICCQLHCAFAVLLLCFCFCFAVLLSPATLDQRLWSCGHLVLRLALAALPSPYSGANQKVWSTSTEHALQIMAACYVTTTKVAAGSSSHLITSTSHSHSALESFLCANCRRAHQHPRRAPNDHVASPLIPTHFLY
ncbi:hypothetical protein M431DRAFT_208368 [Trichoderma harzianum CBS 226.95]|uniref:Uncharacterized protein n=1 Tax=Trichoderma harzianum CBS 226.95 TaxID=983964 RepID=A0A2T4AW69_TRIHA|nr:hypothetical protein M431DRAFT_208368 [Trichoderma harzianum CBS 226.95]PTB61291.1 hypothetical protein M431DRAFT_208368 [Trichoderma harzianum CBS 226.95]